MVNSMMLARSLHGACEFGRIESPAGRRYGRGRVAPVLEVNLIGPFLLCRAFVLLADADRDDGESGADGEEEIPEAPVLRHLRCETRTGLRP